MCCNCYTVSSHVKRFAKTPSAIIICRSCSITHFTVYMVASSSLQKYAMYSVAVLWVIKNFAVNMSSGSSGKRPKDAESSSAEVAADGTSSNNKMSKGTKKKAIDAEARRHSIALAKICFQSWTSQESLTFFSLLSVLLLRTLLSFFTADIDGQIVKTLINGERRQLIAAIASWFAVAIPASFVNSLIKYLQSRLSIGLRGRLVAYARDKFFANDAFYRIFNHSVAPEGGDEMAHQRRQLLQHPEVVLTEDIAKWADRFAEMTGSIGKPLVDLAFFSGVLYQKLGFINQFAASVFVWETGNLLKRFRPDVTKIISRRSQLEADFRGRHNSIIANSEEIAFCHGEAREQERLHGMFSRIVSFEESNLSRHVIYHTMEDFLTKYVWSLVGMIQVALPLLKSGSSAGDNAKYFITIRRVMVKNGDAVERCLAGIKDAIEFNAYTMNIVNFLKGLDDSHAEARMPELLAKSGDDYANASSTSSRPVIRIVDVPIRTPSGDALVHRLNLSLFEGDRLLVLGPNGCGKSSLFRILCGLWPHTEGHIERPSNPRDLFFVPQRPYLVSGTFRDQVIYPDTVDEMHARGISDSDILRILDDCLMTGPLEAHGPSLDTVKEWVDVLSGGEKQRLGLARVLYHKPKFAILDECSSAINVEAERAIFEKLTATGMGFITISHRQSLFPLHNKLLTFDGEGGARFDESFTFDALQEVAAKKLEWMSRLQRVLQDLGESWPETATEAFA